MKSHFAWRSLALAPAAVVLALTLGCTGGGSTPTQDNPGGDTNTNVEPPKPKAAIPIKDAKGVLKGKVTLKGEWNKPEKDDAKKKAIDAGANASDKDHCLKGDTEDMRLLVKDGGVKNAVVWVIPGDSNSFFKMDKAEVDEIVKKRAANDKTKPVLDQPFCAFKPHVLALFTKYPSEDGKKMFDTGEQLTVANSAAVGHNTKLTRGANELANVNIPKGTDPAKVTIPANDAQVVRAQCNVHGFMEGFIWAVDTPFVAVTDENGNFEIQGVPTDKDLKIVCWHELGGSGGFINDGKSNGKKVKVGADKPLEENFVLEPKQ